MSAAPKLPADSVNLIIPDLLPACVTALKAAEQLLGTATAAVAQIVRGVDGRIDAARLEEEQFATHGRAWPASYVPPLKEHPHRSEPSRVEKEGIRPGRYRECP